MEQADLRHIIVSIVISFMAMFFFFDASSQDKGAREEIKKDTDLESLKEIEQKPDFVEDSIFFKAKKLNIPILIVDDHGNMGILYAFDEKNKPTYGFDDLDQQLVNYLLKTSDSTTIFGPQNDLDSLNFVKRKHPKKRKKNDQ